MTWNDFNKDAETVIYNGQVRTDIDCPICGKKVLWDSRVVLASFPPQYSYWCPCGWSGNSYKKWGKE